MLEKKIGTATPDKLLFHGTSSTDPALIYNGEFGFDMRFCSNGMWGIAIYFAEFASFCDQHYPYKNSLGYKQVFLARVAIGNCVHLDANFSLRKPPAKNSINNMGFQEDYDTVSGDHPWKSKVYMLYENGRAYPEYVITYK